MAKGDLQARPIFHHKKDSIDAHLAIVFAALAAARRLQTRTGVTIKKLVRALRPLRSVTMTIAGEQVTAHLRLDAETSELLARIPDFTGHQNRALLWNSGLTSTGVVRFRFWEGGPRSQRLVRGGFWGTNQCL
jgi:hypothetical protein